MAEKGYRDREENEIGTAENWGLAICNIYRELECWYNRASDDDDPLKAAIYDYKAIRYCYDGNTQLVDEKINCELNYFGPDHLPKV